MLNNIQLDTIILVFGDKSFEAINNEKYTKCTDIKIDTKTNPDTSKLALAEAYEKNYENLNQKLSETIAHMHITVHKSEIITQQL